MQRKMVSEAAGSRPLLPAASERVGAAGRALRDLRDARRVTGTTAAAIGVTQTTGAA